MKIAGISFIIISVLFVFQFIQINKTYFKPIKPEIGLATSARPDDWDNLSEKQKQAWYDEDKINQEIEYQERLNYAIKSQMDDFVFSMKITGGIQFLLFIIAGLSLIIDSSKYKLKD